MEEKDRSAFSSPILIRIPCIRKSSDASEKTKSPFTAFEDETTDATNDLNVKLTNPDAHVTRYSENATIGKMALEKRAYRIKKYKQWQIKRWGNKLDEHRRAIRGFKGRSDVAIAKPRINGKYVKKEVYQAWLSENPHFTI